MYYFVDESGNTGLHLFDANQPVLYYGVLGARTNWDITAEPVLKKAREILGVRRLHANELGVSRLTTIAHDLTVFSKKNDLQFSMYKVIKPDHAIITFFDQVFDSALNGAVRWMDYWTPLRYLLLFKVASLFDEEIAKDAWGCRREPNPARCAARLTALCLKLVKRINQLPDERSREIIGGALRWAAKNPERIDYGVGNYDSALQISPNLVGFQQVLAGIAKDSAVKGQKINRITVDQQSEFNGAQAEPAEIYAKLRGHSQEMGPGMPKADYSSMPKLPPSFLAGNQSPGLELVDITLWTAKRLEEGKPVSDELRSLVRTQARRGKTDEVSLRGLDRRWHHLLALPEPTGPLPEKLAEFIDKQEMELLTAVSNL